MAVVARLFGTPADVIPPTLADFRQYVAEQLEGPTITVTPPAREIAAVILEAPMPAPLRLFGPAHRLATAAQLPPRLRQEYGLRFAAGQRLALPPAARFVKLTMAPVLFAASRVAPAPRAVPLSVRP